MQHDKQAQRRVIIFGAQVCMYVCMFVSRRVGKWIGISESLH